MEVLPPEIIDTIARCVDWRTWGRLKLVCRYAANVLAGQDPYALFTKVRDEVDMIRRYNAFDGGYFYIGYRSYSLRTIDGTEIKYVYHCPDTVEPQYTIEYPLLRVRLNYRHNAKTGKCTLERCAKIDSRYEKIKVVPITLKQYDDAVADL
ncbi:hypothetical protein F-M6_0326 [Faustovirus]|nr:hypothetical protein F-LCD7_0321 [Faustovirus]QJX72089.1 hypothetical protein F-M6_0326 [Faustovirus]QJX73080.1 hypothetical protein F-VV57_0319 [Faustovirus]QJX73587.1 hypothetical protein F-VV63_0321 [Faustovirus]SMH63581.1 Hypothetical protein FSTVLC9_99 [Faustovirus]